MLKEILTGLALIFVGLLPSAWGDEGLSESHSSDDTLANLIVNFKNNCPEYRDPVFCFSWDSNELADLQSANFLNERGPKPRGRDAPESPSEFPETHLHKRFLVVRRKTPTARGCKRGPGFRSWGGKRNSAVNCNWENFGKRTKFGPWGGKRSEEYFSDDSLNSDPGKWTEKRAKFDNWGGKRTAEELSERPKLLDLSVKRGFIWKDKGFYLNEPFKKAVPKRPQFQSWGGKRGSYPWRKILSFINSRPSGFGVNGGEKRKFSSWGGKRYENSREEITGETFQNWESQKSSSEGSSSAEDFFDPKKSTWGDNSMQYDWESTEPPFAIVACQKGKQECNMR